MTTGKYQCDGVLDSQEWHQFFRPRAYGVPIPVIALRPNAEHDTQAKLDPVPKRWDLADVERPGK